MAFELRLSIPTKMARAEAGQVQYDPELDDVGSVLHDICDALEVADVGFVVRVCSDEDWPVTVGRDLLIVIEQLNDVLTSLKRGDVGRLDFYEQGIERTILFLPNNGTISVECSDMIPKATSRPEVAILSGELIIKELASLAEDFIRAARMRCPELTSHRWFEEWAMTLQHTVDDLRVDQNPGCRH